MGKELSVLANLITKLDEDFAWRRKELSVFKSKIPFTMSPLQGVMLRSGLVLLYAHWEGFVKISMSCYLEHISRRYLKNNQLTTRFLALSLQKKLSDLSINDYEVKTRTIEYLFGEYSKQSNIPKSNIINTKSNLRFDVLKEILYLLDLDNTHVDNHEVLINDLVNIRNHIAHGEYNALDYTTFVSFYDDIIALMEFLKTEISNNAVNKTYELVEPLLIPNPTI